MIIAMQGPRMVRDVFRLAKENAPAIIFIDEVDAIATARFDAQTGADREVQRILMELLNQMDGFDQTVNVKVGFSDCMTVTATCCITVTFGQNLLQLYLVMCNYPAMH